MDMTVKVISNSSQSVYWIAVEVFSNEVDLGCLIAFLLRSGLVVNVEPGNPYGEEKIWIINNIRSDTQLPQNQLF